MLRNKNLRGFLSLFSVLIILSGILSSTTFGEDNIASLAKVDLREKALKKIDFNLINELEDKDFAEILVYLKEQVDIETVAKNAKKTMDTLITPYNTKLNIRKEVIETLKDKAYTTQVNILDYLQKEKEKGNVIEFNSFHIVNMIYVKATKEVVENIAYMGEVERIYKNQIHKIDKPIINSVDNDLESIDGLEWNIERIKAHEVWELGFDGSGVVIGIIDSGVAWEHPALKEKWRGYNKETGEVDPIGNWFDAVGDNPMPYDIVDSPHGTHVLGTTLGQEPDGSNKIGVAPGAQWIAAKAFTKFGGTDAQLLAAGQWMLEPGGDLSKAPDIINNSWGGAAGINDWYRDMFNSWRAAGIIPVFSAGNQRPGEPAPWPGSIICPANYPESFAVAATDLNNIRGSFSKLGPSPYDETIIKPNISAPGVNIRSSVPGGYEGGWNGTSMAAPAISGVAALMLSANSSLSVDDIEEIIQNTATPLTDSNYPEAPNMGYGYGLVNALEAVLSVAPGTGSLSGRVIDECEIPVAEAVITILESGRSVKTDSNGNFFMRHFYGKEYTLRVEAYGYYTKDIKVDVFEDQDTNMLIALDSKLKGTIVGRVIQRYNNEPINNALVRIVEDGKIAPAITDENGEFIFTGVYEGDYTLKITADGYELGTKMVKVTGDQTISIEIGLRKFIGYEGEISYDDGIGENALVLNNIGNGLAVRFTPEQYGKVKTANIYFWDTSWPTPGGNRIGIGIFEVDDNGLSRMVGQPIYQSITRGTWNRIDLSRYNLATDRDFYISTIQEKTKSYSPGVGVDESSSYGNRSYLYVNGKFEPISLEDIDGSFMIRAIMEYSIGTPEITNLEALNYTNQDFIMVKGRVGLESKVNIYVNGEKTIAVDSENRSFAVEVELPLEENTIMATMRLNGIETEPSDIVRVIKDKEPPVLIVGEPLNNIEISDEEIYILGNVVDNTKVRKLLINGIEVQFDEYGNFYKKILVEEGENIITIKAIDMAGNESIIERMVNVELQLSNIEPSRDIYLKKGEILSIDFNGPRRRLGFFRVFSQEEPPENQYRFPMDEVEPGLYSGTWTVPQGIEGSNLLIEVILVDNLGNELVEIAQGKLTIICDIRDLPNNAVIIDREAFDIRYLDNNNEAQIKLLNWQSQGKAVYVKLNSNTIVNEKGVVVGIGILPKEITYYDISGNTKLYRE